MSLHENLWVKSYFPTLGNNVYNCAIVRNLILRHASLYNPLCTIDSTIKSYIVCCQTHHHQLQVTTLTTILHWDDSERVISKMSFFFFRVICVTSFLHSACCSQWRISEIYRYQDCLHKPGTWQKVCVWNDNHNNKGICALPPAHKFANTWKLLSILKQIQPKKRICIGSEIETERERETEYIGSPPQCLAKGLPGGLCYPTMALAFHSWTMFQYSSWKAYKHVSFPLSLSVPPELTLSPGKCRSTVYLYVNKWLP